MLTWTGLDVKELLSEATSASPAPRAATCPSEAVVGISSTPGVERFANTREPGSSSSEDEVSGTLLPARTRYAVALATVSRADGAMCAQPGAARDEDGVQSGVWASSRNKVVMWWCRVTPNARRVRTGLAEGHSRRRPRPPPRRWRKPSRTRIRSTSSDLLSGNVAESRRS